MSEAHNHLDGPHYHGTESGCYCDRKQAVYAITLVSWQGDIGTVLGEGRLIVNDGAEMMPAEFLTKPHENLTLSFCRLAPGNK